MLLIEREAKELVYLTLQQRLSEDLGIVSGKIYLMSPDPIYINERTEEINNIDQTRFPSISIEPYSEKIIWTTSNPVKYYDTSYINMTSGQVKVYNSDLLIRETLILTVSTATKRDYRYYHEAILRFFQKYIYGMEILNDILPVKQHILFNIPKDIKFDLTHAPYYSSVKIDLNYRIYSENVKYLVKRISSQIVHTNNGTSGNALTTIITPRIE